MRKQLTVVIPHYSETPDMIESTLMSIKHQVGYDLNKIEVVLVDDCGPVELTKENLSHMRLPFDMTFLKTEKNSGPG